jgi:hypothetical protein
MPNRLRRSLRALTASFIGLGISLAALPALAAVGRPQLQHVIGAPSGAPTVVFIHGKGDCSYQMSSCNGYGESTGVVGYWINDNNGRTMLSEASVKINASGANTQYDTFAVGYDMENQGFWNSANDVAACLTDLYSGTNASGCNPSLYMRSNFSIVTHSAGATVMDRIVSSGWWPTLTSRIVGDIVSLAPALVGSKASSALYGVDGQSTVCTSIISALGGFGLENNGAQSLTRGNVLAAASSSDAGKSPIWFLKIVTTGGSYSANNDGAGTLWGGTTVREDDEDLEMGALAGCLGYSNSDDMDGLLYWSDSDPTANTSGNGCNTSDTNDGKVNSCHYYAQYSGAYWHWLTSWANHSHSRDDAYNTLGDHATATTCMTRSPGTCVAFGI